MIGRSIHTACDKVVIRELAASAVIGTDAWNNKSAQPILISVLLATDFQKASVSDDLQYSLNYAVISRNISRFIKANETRNFNSLRGIGEAVGKLVLDKKNTGGGTPEAAEIIIESTKTEIRAKSVRFILNRSANASDELDTLQINGLRLLTVIGVFTFERLQKQFVDLDISIELQRTATLLPNQVINDITSYVESANFKTVEALVSRIGQLIYQQNPSISVDSVTITVIKPNAINWTNGVGVKSRMTGASFADVKPIDLLVTSEATPFNLPVQFQDIDLKDHTVYIAFGTNEGNQMENIQAALRHLNDYDIKVEATSSMYISKPMYYKDQADFYNGVIKVITKKTPHELLEALKKIEYEHINRIKEFDNGPRLIDLDIILYDNITLNTEDLVIPHKLMLERTFVMQPLCELAGPDFIHPISTEPIHNHLKELLLGQGNDELQECHKLEHYVPLIRLHTKLDLSKTVIMAIVNITPDSFSDGGSHFSKPHQDIIGKCLKLVSDGAEIIDIGGVSTRPGSNEPSLEEELNRVVPVIKAIRSEDSLSKVLISVDTYRSEVAEAVLIAGADIINDVLMGLYDPKIFDVVAKFGCPYIMSHIRGTPQTMSSMTVYEPNTDELVEEFYIDPLVGQLPVKDVLISAIAYELSTQITAAFNAGVCKWQIIVDPGIGFAKNVKQNLHILSHASLLKQYAVTKEDSFLSFTFPTLLGTSRKKFLGEITGQNDPARRVISSTSAVIASIQQQADIVRVHDVAETKEAVSTGDAIYKGLF